MREQQLLTSHSWSRCSLRQEPPTAPADKTKNGTWSGSSLEAPHSLVLSTQYLWTLVPKTMKGMVSETSNMKYLDPLGLIYFSR